MLRTLAIREVRRHVAPLRTGGEDAAVVAVPGGEVLVGAQLRREVSVIAVSNADLRDQIQPLVDAGFHVEGVGTPALALLALARSRSAGASSVPVAYVAIAPRSVCVAIVRHGVLLSAAETGWADPELTVEPMGPRLKTCLERSVRCAEQAIGTTVHSVVLCGALNLDAATRPLVDALGIPVVALDPLAGVDAAVECDPGDRVRTDVATLRVVIAAGADPSPVANLLPAPIVATGRRRNAMVRIAAIVLWLLLAAAWLSAAPGAAEQVPLGPFAPGHQLDDTYGRDRGAEGLHRARLSRRLHLPARAAGHGRRGGGTC
jgi:hypothetical protein